MSIADVEVIAFGSRSLRLGDGVWTNSPSDVSRMLQVEKASEDDVIHAKTLPTYGDTLSREEGECCSLIGWNLLGLP